MTFLLVIIYFSFISLGLPDSLFGAVWPVLHQDFAVPISFGGYVGMIVSLCTVVSSLLAERLHKWFGTGRIIAYSTLMTAASLLGYSITPNYWILFPLAVVLGLGAGAIDSALNNYVALHYKASHMSFLHCCWGVGCSIGPLILSFAMKNHTWRTGYRIIALIQLSLAIVQFLTIKKWAGKDGKKNEVESSTNSDSLESSTKSESSKTETFFKPTVNPRTTIFAFLSFFVYCSYETSAIVWIATFFVQVLGTTERLGAFASSAFFIGITSGRFISGFISDKVGVKKMIFIGAALALFSSIIFFVSRSVPLSFAMAVLIGMGCGPIYPSMIHRTPRRFGSDLSPKIIGRQMASAYVGSTLAPPILGNLAVIFSFKILPIFGIILMALLILFTLIIERSHAN